MPWNFRFDRMVKEAVPGSGVLPTNYRPSSDDDVPPGRMCGNCENFLDGMCTLFDHVVEESWYCNSWEPDEDEVVTKAYDPQQPRAEDGKWTAAGAGSAGLSAGTVFDNLLAKPEPERGVSVNIIGEEPTDGFMVAFAGSEMPVSEEEFVANGPQVIRDYLRDQRDALAASEKTYMGIWFNEKERRYEFDLSEKVATRDSAISIGRERQQEAAWDVERGELVFIGARDNTRQE
jgi:hypothetical protein